MFARLDRVAWKASLLAILRALFSFTIVLAASGNLDTTFSGDGKQTTDVDAANAGWNDSAFAVAVQPDGKIVAIGVSGDNQTDSNFALARYTPNGSLDPSFSFDGKLIADTGGWDRALGVAIQPYGRIVAVGTSCTDSSWNMCYLLVERFLANGRADITFNGYGRKAVSWNGRSTGATGGVAIQPDGKILVGAAAPNGSVTDLAVVRFNPNGSLDKTFNGTGKRSVSFGAGIGSWAAESWGRNLALQKDGKIVISGGTSTGNFAVLRLNPNGALDATFSGDGKQATDFGGTDYGRAVALQPDGKIVVVGQKETATTTSMAVARYRPNGSLDTTFNVTGKRLIIMAGSARFSGMSVVVQPNGKIVIAGTAANTSTSDCALVRLNPNGSLDTSFSGDGKATFDFSGGADTCSGLALDNSGKYVLAGVAAMNGQLDFGLLRVLP